MQAHLGEIVALATAVCWATTSLFFTIAGQQVGSQLVNRVRLPLAALFLAVTHLVWRGEALPIHAEPSRWGWLGLSAISGLVMGDGLLFQAFVLIGTRLSMLLMTLVPVTSTLLAWVFLDETLSLLEISAIIVTVSSVAWVVSERGNPTVRVELSPATAGRVARSGAEGVSRPRERAWQSRLASICTLRALLGRRYEPLLDASSTPMGNLDSEESNRKHYVIGVLCGIGGASGQALGLILSKRGMVGDFPPLSASLMRLLMATAVIWLWALMQGQIRPTIEGLQAKRVRRAILGGTVAGPFIGMTLSLAAVQLAPVGIASTLMSLSPVLLLPLAHWIFKERITKRAIVGTAVAMVGVAMIFWT